MVTMWPFRRHGSRSSRRRSRTAPLVPDDELRGRRDSQPPRRITEPSAPIPIPIGKRRSTAKLQRRNRAYSFSPGRNDSIRIQRAHTKRQLENLPTGSLPVFTDSIYGDTEVSASRNMEAMPRVPTLHHNHSRQKRSGQPLLRKKSSKRRKEDHDREAEIKAMSHFMPVRPTADFMTVGQMTRRETRRPKGDARQSWDQRPYSEESLPMSVNSGASTDSEGVAWRVSALAALAPRPTLRYSSSPVFPAQTDTVAPLRAASSRRRLAEKEPIAETTLKAHKRVDDLADDLDASDLRELMERDQRRREQRREKERLRVEKRLARRAEKQQAEEAAAAKSGTPPPQNMERGVLGRDVAGLSNDSTSAIVTSSKRRSSTSLAKRQSHGSGNEAQRPSSIRSSTRQQRTPSPLEEFHRTESMPSTPAESIRSEPEEMVVDPPSHTESKPRRTSSSRSLSPRLIGFLRSRKSRSKSPKHSESSKVDIAAPSPAFAKGEDGESSSKASNKSSKPWRSLLRWASRSKRNSTGPSSFSNTSRDSMSVHQPPPPPTNYIPPRRVSNSVPKRTMSRFREDLPELPISPPDSRVASPEAENLACEPLPVITDDVQMRYDTPISTSHRSQEAIGASPSTLHREELGPSPAPQSMSLASIDSEGSWLSGGRMKQRASVGMNSLQLGSIKNVSEGSDAHNSDDDAVVNDEYLHNVVASKDQRQSTGEARPSSDEDEEMGEPRWGAVAQTPRVMRHRETIQSREGLLLQTVDEPEMGKTTEGDEATDSPVSPVGEPQRATSVNLSKGHVRNFSAGSARLLDVSPRASGEVRKSIGEYEAI